MRSALLTATAVAGGNGLVFALAAALMIPPPDAVPATVEIVTPPAIEAVHATSPAAAAGVQTSHVPAISRGSVAPMSATVRAAAPTKKAEGGCKAGHGKVDGKTVRVARNAAVAGHPDGA